MATFDEILTIHRIERVELTCWIEQRWVRPQRTAEGYLFDPVDEARISLIGELRRDFACDDDVLGLVLSLLDQLYAARQLLRTVEEAVDALPADVRASIRAHLRSPGRFDEGR
ncbi:MAG TPA: chaperone modulator CbpM [Rhodospirillales bacterium]|jgi:chaperone modulatory protein CbpM|nr:chaperone modulator CbpM [Rhodospirillales bacterium]